MPLATRRTFLLLQGPQSPLFARLAATLERAGVGVVKVDICGADIVFGGAGRGRARRFRGRFADWPAYVGGLMDEERVTDIVVFGDCRPYHRVALDLARARNVRVFVMEEGYVRPNWVTLEAGGVNGQSQLPRDPDFYPAVVERDHLDRPEEVQQGRFGTARALYAILAHLGNGLLSPFFPHYQSHRPYWVMLEALGWLRRGLAHSRERRAAQRVQAEMESGDAPFYLFPLQLDADPQVALYSPYVSVEEAIREVVASFARHASPVARLLIKVHPMHNGLIDFRRILRDAAERNAIAGRVFYMDGGNMVSLLDRTAGVVVINSTVGISALFHHRPVIVLGQAIYDIPGLTFRGSLDAFWTEATPPDAALFNAFRRVLIHKTQLNGNLYTRAGIELVVAHAMARFGLAVAPSVVEEMAAAVAPSQG